MKSAKKRRPHCERVAGRMNWGRHIGATHVNVILKLP